MCATTTKESTSKMNGDEKTSSAPAASAAPDPKIIDLLLNKKKEGEEGSKPLTSIEFFPPRTEEGVKNLKSRMGRMLTNSKPVFSDITWGAGGSTADLTLDLALYLHNTGHVSNMHLTCTNMSRDMLVNALQKAHEGGIRNIVALRGDPPAGQDVWEKSENGFGCALDLVKYIRAEFGNDFGISVAGYPEGHPDAIVAVDDVSTLTDAEKGRSSVRDGVTYVCRDEDYIKEMNYLKSKIDAGGEFIITQMFFDTKVFDTFVKDCRKYGITCPIIPGLMCINAYGGFRKMTKFCKTRVPTWLDDKMESLKDDAMAVKIFGVDFATQMCSELIEQQNAPVLHFYTLNLERVVYGVTDKLGWTNLGESALNKVDADAKSMQAVGSAWARVGDSVKSIYGTGVVTDVRKSDGMTTIVLESWNLANGQKPTLYLKQGSFQKVF